MQLHTYVPTELHAYRATRLQRYTHTRIRKQRGTRNGTPQHSWSLLLSSPKKSLNIGVTACGHDIGELAIVGYLTACCRTAGLQGCTATELQGYGATTLHRRLLATYRYPRCAQPRENHPSGHRWQSLLMIFDRGSTLLTCVAELAKRFIMRAAKALEGKYCESELPKSRGVNVPATAFL